MADQLICNIKRLPVFSPLSLRYTEKATELCGRYGVSAGKKSSQTASGEYIVVDQNGQLELWLDNKRIIPSKMQHRHSSGVENIIFPSQSDLFVSIACNQVKCWRIERITSLFHCHHTIHLPSLIGPNMKYDKKYVSFSHILLWSDDKSVLKVFPYCFSAEKLTIGEHYSFPFKQIYEICQEEELFSIKYNSGSPYEAILQCFLDCSPGKPPTLRQCQ